MKLIPLIIITLMLNQVTETINLGDNLWKTWKNTSFYAFLGIRYALPPVDLYRFKV